MISTTLVVSVVVVAVLGIFLVQQIASGLYNNARKAALVQTSDGLTFAQSDPDVQSPGGSTTSALISLVTALQSGSGLGNIYDVVLLQRGTNSGLAGVTGNQALAPSIPPGLEERITDEQLNGSVTFYTAPATLLSTTGKKLGPALAVGVPISRDGQLYYLFPLSQQVQVLRLVQNTLIIAGVGLVLLLALIVSLVTRWVVVPIRQGAQAASRVSAGNLDERMAARGTDDLAALAHSFNEMAASLQEKLRELEELSSVQRQFVSDVSHELRTPLTTIRIAADVLFGTKDTLEPAAKRSAELLQSQIDRFEALLADLLEISRHDANVATLDAESADVCDLVLRAAADAEQLAAQRGTRIEFRLPPQQCIAEVDRRRVERVLRNLLDNAVEHGEGRDVVVTVAADRDAVAVAVRDHGVGLGPGEHQLSSTVSGVPTRPGPGPPAVPGSAWPSPWRTPGCTPGGCRPGGSGAAARSSGSRCRAPSAASSPGRRCRCAPTRLRYPRPVRSQRGLGDLLRRRCRAGAHRAGQHRCLTRELPVPAAPAA